MIAAATRQDLQTALDRTKNSIMGSVFSRSEAQNIMAQLRNGILQDLRELHSENQAGIRLAQTQHSEMIQRIAGLQQQMARLTEQQAQTLSILQQILQPNGTLRRF
jgi:hypothetical protein